jgi:hypothetical protein
MSCISINIVDKDVIITLKGLRSMAENYLVVKFLTQEYNFN